MPINGQKFQPSGGAGDDGHADAARSIGPIVRVLSF